MGRTVLDLFCGAGGFSLGFEWAGYDVLAGVDVDETALDTFAANHDARAIECDLATVDPETFAHEYDIHPSDVDVVIGGPPCLPEGHPILTYEGYVDISDVAVGQRVLTHEGNYREVVDRGHKQYSGELTVLDLKYRAEPIHITPEHPVLTEDGWIEAGELTKNHSIAFPKRKNTAVRDDFTYESKLNQFTSEERSVSITGYETWRFVGAYLAEGWRRKEGGYEITLGVHEDDVSRTVTWVEDAWGETDTWTESTEGKGVKVTFCDEGVWKFLEQFGDGAHNKRIPPWVMDMPSQWVEGLLDGYVSCDGHEKETRIRWTSVSRELVEGVQRLWYRVHGTLPSTRKQEHQGSSIIQGRKIERSDMYAGLVPTSGTNHGCLGENSDRLYVPLSSVSSEKFRGTVYNLEVAGDNSYCTHLAALHNCQGFSTAQANRDPDDPRNNLVFRFARYVDHYQPESFVMENVTGITSIDDGETVELLCEDFRQAGYSVEYATLNAADYGVPQKRRRVFFVGQQDGEPAFPEPTHAPSEEIDEPTVTALDDALRTPTALEGAISD
jgi:site-specific DNA-cytosine methylase